MAFINGKVKGLDKLKKEIEYVQNVLILKNDTKYLEYIKSKAIETLNEIINTDLNSTTNDEAIINYSTNNKIEDIANGFIIYNDTQIDVESTNESTIANYPSGKFNIAMAFEYGIGIVGENSPKQNAWQYNVNGHEKGWTYFKNGKFYGTFGYEGKEIYRKTATKINESLQSWTESYLKGEK